MNIDFTYHFLKYAAPILAAVMLRQQTCVSQAHQQNPNSMSMCASSAGIHDARPTPLMFSRKFPL